MPIKKTPRALIDVLDAEGKITGHELEVHVTYEPDGEKDEMAALFTPHVKREPISGEEAQKLRGIADEIMTDKFAESQDQIAEMQSAAEAAQVAANNACNDLQAQVDEHRERANKAEKKLDDIKKFLAS